MGHQSYLCYHELILSDHFFLTIGNWTKAALVKQVYWVMEKKSNVRVCSHTEGRIAREIMGGSIGKLEMIKKALWDKSCKR